MRELGELEASIQQALLHPRSRPESLSMAKIGSPVMNRYDHPFDRLQARVLQQISFGALDIDLQEVDAANLVLTDELVPID